MVTFQIRQTESRRAGSQGTHWYRIAGLQEKALAIEAVGGTRNTLFLASRSPTLAGTTEDIGITTTAREIGPAGCPAEAAK